MIQVFYNPKANNEHGMIGARAVETLFENERYNYIDFTEIDDIYEYMSNISKEDKIVLTGGDGTLNVFANKINNRELPFDVFYCPAGSGNDFWKDVSNGKDFGIIKLNPYIEKLPSVLINGKKYLFVNGVGFGLDGYCCEEADRQRAKSTKPTNYTAIAIKGLLYAFKPRKAKISAEGKLLGEFKYVWIAPVMNGRYYGGGMMVAPMQDRLNKERTLSSLVMHSGNKLKALILFPQIFSGKLAEHTDIAKCFTAKNIVVEYEQPCAVQIDGETILGVSKCEYFSYNE